MREDYPILLDYDSLTTDEDLLRFCFYFAAPDSPVAEQRDMAIRIERCIQLVDPSDPNDIRDKVTKSHKEYEDTITAIFRIYQNRKFLLWFSMVWNIHIMAEKLRSKSGIKDNERRQLSKMILALDSDVDELEYSLFRNDFMKESLLRAADRNSLSGYAEKYALTSP